MRKLLSLFTLIAFITGNFYAPFIATTHAAWGDIAPAGVSLASNLLWIRAEDAVKEWEILKVVDRSNNKRVFTSPNADRSPKIGSSDNSSSLIFDGTNDILVSETSWNLWTTQPNFTAFFVWKTKTNHSTQSVLAHWETRDMTDGYYLWLQSNAAFIAAENRAFFFSNINKPQNSSIVKWTKQNNTLWISINNKEPLTQNSVDVINTSWDKKLLIGNMATDSSWFGPYSGDYKELLVFNWQLSNEDSQKIMTYLACKHSLPLDTSIENNYVNKNWDVIWSYADNINYRVNPTCIIRDDASWLNKLISKSAYDNADITVSVNSLDNLESLVWSNNGWSLNIIDSYIPSNYWRVERSWRVSETQWDVWNVKVSIPLSFFPNIREDVNIYIAKRNNNADFNHWDTEFIRGTYKADTKIFEFDVNFNDGDYFTIAFDSHNGPGWVRKPTLTTWFKASHKFQNNSWQSDTIYKTDATNTTGTAPQLSNNVINFEPQIKFTGQDKLNTHDLKTNWFINVPTLNSGKIEGSIFVVYNASKSDAWLILRQAKRNELLNVRLWSSLVASKFRDWAVEDIIPARSKPSIMWLVMKNNWDIWEVKTYLDWQLKKTSNLYSKYIYEQEAPLVIGQWYIGDIAEIISYSVPVTTNEQESIESYLACKYGISLRNENGNRNYINSRWQTIWSTTDNVWYDNNVGCIHRDDIAGLKKEMAQSQESEKGNIIVNTALNSDLLSLTWSDNGWNLWEWIYGKVDGEKKTSAKIIRFSEKNWDTGDVTIKIKKSDLPYFRWSLQLLLKNGDNNFKNGAQSYNATDDGDFYKFVLNVSDNDYLTLQYTPEELAQPSLWLNPSIDLTVINWSVDKWISKNNIEFLPATTQKPTIKENAINGNKVLLFNNSPLKAKNSFSFETSKDYEFLVVSTLNETTGTLFSQWDKKGKYNPIIKNDNTISVSDSGNNSAITTTATNTNLPVIMNYKNTYNIADNKSKISVYKNRGEVVTMEEGVTPLQSSQIVETLIWWDTNTSLSGWLAEIIGFNKNLTDTERELATSYLAIKYGLTLDSWDLKIGGSNKSVYVRDNDFNQNITAIAKSPDFSLNQTKSMNIYDKKWIEISAEGFEDGAWMSIASNNKPYTWTWNKMPLGYYGYEKSWKVGFADKKPTNISMKVNHNLLTTWFGGNLRMYISNENDFSTGKYTEILTAEKAGNDWIFRNVNLNDGQYFTIWYYSNVPPTDVMMNGAYEASIEENKAKGSEVATISWVDWNNDPLNFTLNCATPWADDSKFTIDGDKLKTNASFDYEDKNTYNICIRASDVVNSTFDKNLVVKVLNVNEAPTDITLKTTSITENNQAWVAMSLIETTDVDSNTFTYSLVSWEGSDDNTNFSIQWDKLIINNSTDFEAKEEYKIRIKSVDNGWLSTEKSFVIKVINVDDTAPEITITQWVYLGPASSNVVKFSVKDIETSWIKSVRYAYSTNNICTDWDVYTSLTINNPHVENSYSIPHDDESKNNLFFCIQAEDNAGNVKNYVSQNKFYIRTTPPYKPVITSPSQTDGWVTNNKRAIISGTTEIGTNVIIKSNTGQELCRTTTPSTDGNFSCTLTQDLLEGQQILKAIACDTAVSTPNCSEGQNLTVTIDTVIPQAPVYKNPVNNGSYKAVHSITLKWEGKTTAYITIKKWSDVILQANGPLNESWDATITIPNPFDEDRSDYTIEAYLKDKAWNQGNTATITIGIDNVAPNSVTVTTPALNSTINDNTPTITWGNWEVWATLEVSYTNKENKAKKQTIDITQNDWSITLDEELSEGDNSIKLLQTDKAGNKSQILTHTFKVDTLPPELPTVNSPNWYIKTREFTLIGWSSRSDSVEIEWNWEKWNEVINTNWEWRATKTAQSDGEQIVKIRSFDANGNYTAVVEHKFIIDTEEPQIPVFTKPFGNTTSNNTTPQFIVAWEPNIPSFIIVSKKDWGQEVKRFEETATNIGAYIGTITNELENGTYLVSAYQIDKAWNRSQTTTIEYTVDTNAPDKPVITYPVNMDTVNSRSFNMIGKAEENSKVKIVINGNIEFETTANQDGDFSLPITVNNDWRFNYTISATDEQNNVSPSTIWIFNVDTIAPKEVELTSPLRVNSKTPLLTWKAEENSVITVKGTTCITNQEGIFTCPALLQPLAEGSNNVTIKSCDSAKPQPNCSTKTFVLDVDTTPPAIPTISSPKEWELINTKQPQIVGTSNEPDNTAVKVVIGSNTFNGVVNNGRISVNIDKDLAEGENTATITLTDELGNESAPLVRKFLIDTEIPLAPSITSHQAETYSQSDTFVIKWQAEPLADIIITFNGKEITGKANNSWEYSITVNDTTLVEQSYELSVKQKDLAKNVSPESKITIHIDRTAPTLPTITSHNVGDTISSSSITLKWTASEAKGKVKFKIWNEEFAWDINNWEWTVLIPGKLSEGFNNLTYWQEDEAENYSNPKWSFGIIVDTSAPNMAIIEEPIDNSFIKEKRPTIIFQWEAGSDYELIVWGKTYNWRINQLWNSERVQVDVDLADGEHTVKIKLTDKLWNTNGLYAQSKFTIDTVKPSKPTITNEQNKHYNDNPTIAGTADNDTVVVMKSNSWEFNVNVDSNWAFSVPLSNLSDGTYTIKFSSKDKAWNVSDEVDYTFIVDKTKPATPDMVVNARYNTQDISIQWNWEGSIKTHFEVKDKAWISLKQWSVDTGNDWKFTLDFNVWEWEYDIEAWQVDKAWNVSDKIKKSFIVDTTPPVTPTISQPLTNTLTNLKDFQLIVSAQEEGKIDVLLNDTIIKTIPDYVSWDLTINLTNINLLEGNNKISVKITDKSWNASQARDINVIYDTTSPNAPLIENIVENTVYSLTPNKIKVLWEDNSKVVVKVNGTDFEGNITTQFVELSNVNTFREGPNTLIAYIEDKAGNRSAETIVNFSIDTQAPAEPVVNKDAFYRSQNITLSWTAEANSKIYFKKNNVVICSTTANNNWSYSCDISNLTEGDNTLKVSACDKATPTPNCSQEKEVVVNIDTQAPKKPSIIFPTDRFSTSNSEVEVHFKNEENEAVDYTIMLVGTPRSETWRAQWMEEIKKRLTFTEWANTVKVIVKDKAGNSSDTMVVFYVDTTPPNPPRVLKPKQPQWFIWSKPFALTGRSEALSKVIVYKKGTNDIVSQCQANTSGDFSCNMPIIHTDTATYSILACDTATPQSNCSVREDIHFTIDKIPPRPIEILTPANGIELNSPNLNIILKWEPELRYEVIIEGTKLTGNLDASWNKVIPYVLRSKSAGTIEVHAFDIADNEAISRSTYKYQANAGWNSWWGSLPPPSPAPSAPPASAPSAWTAWAGKIVDAYCYLSGPKTVLNGEAVTLEYQTFYSRNTNMNQWVWKLTDWKGKVAVKPPANQSTLYSVTVENGYWQSASCNLTVTTVKELPKEATPPTPSKDTDTKKPVNTTHVKTTACSYYLIPELKVQTTDISNNWAKNYITSLIATRSMTYTEKLAGKVSFNTPDSKRGIVNNAVLFNPERNLTRAEFLKMLIRAMDCNYIKPTNMNHRYTDVEKWVWYEEYVTYARANWWIGNNGATKFEPNRPISRAEVAKITARAMSSLQFTKPNKAEFSDVATNNEFAPYIHFLKERNIISGQMVNNKTIFRPSDNISRSEMSKIIFNTFLKWNIKTIK